MRPSCHTVRYQSSIRYWVGTLGIFWATYLPLRSQQIFYQKYGPKVSSPLIWYRIIFIPISNSLWPQIPRFNLSMLRHSGISEERQMCWIKCLKIQTNKKVTNLRCRGRCWWWCRTPPPSPPPHPANMNDLTTSVEDPDPGGEKIRILYSRSMIRNKHPGSYFQVLSSNKLDKKCLNSLLRIRIRDLVHFLPRLRDGKRRVRYKHPGFATMLRTTQIHTKNNIKTRKFRRWSKRTSSLRELRWTRSAVQLASPMNFFT